MRIFVSTCDTHDERVSRVLDRLRASPGVEVEHSPLNPEKGDDPRWEGWYRFGLTETVEQADAFVALFTEGYDDSSWMAQEARVGLLLHAREGRPRLFLVRPKDAPVPEDAGALLEKARALPEDPDQAVDALLAQLAEG